MKAVKEQEFSLFFSRSANKQLGIAVSPLPSDSDGGYAIAAVKWEITPGDNELV